MLNQLSNDIKVTEKPYNIEFCYILMADDSEVKKIKEIVKALLDGKSAAEVFVDKNPSNISFEKIKEIEIMVRNEDPFIRLDSKGAKNRPPVINHNLPNSTSYRGRSYIVLNRPKLLDENSEWWNVDSIGNGR